MNLIKKILKCYIMIGNFFLCFNNKKFRVAIKMLGSVGNRKQDTFFESNFTSPVFLMTQYTSNGKLAILTNHTLTRINIYMVTCAVLFGVQLIHVWSSEHLFILSKMILKKIKKEALMMLHFGQVGTEQLRDLFTCIFWYSLKV